MDTEVKILTDDMVGLIHDVDIMREQMIIKRQESDDAALNYRYHIQSAVQIMRVNKKLSYRKCANLLGLSESALKDLLRPGTTSRRKK